MKLPFRQGIVRYHTDVNNNPDFLRKTSDGYISLYVDYNATIITFTQGDVDYLIEEPLPITKAWGPFNNTAHTFQLYWDINVDNGLRSFGYTVLTPIIDFVAPTHPAQNQHWFDKTFNIMKVWSGSAWVEVIRVFAGSLVAGAILVPKTLGSQIGDNTVCYSGSILYDHNAKPIRSTQLNGRGKFLTTESPFYTQQQTVTTVKFETIIEYVTTVEPIPAYSLVTYVLDGQIGLASSALPYRPAVGVVQQDLNAGDVSILTTNGFITNPEWSWAVPANTPLYCGINGHIVTTVATSGMVHYIGYVVSHDTMFLEKSLPIHYYDPTQTNTTVPLEVDIVTGRIIASANTGSSNSNYSNHSNSTSGYKYLKSTATLIWNIHHNSNSTDFLCQVYDTQGNQILPDSIKHTDANTVIIKFNANQAGTALLTFII